MKQIKRVPLLLVFVLCFCIYEIHAQASITIEVNWPNWSSENRVTLRNPSGTNILPRICNPLFCYNGSANNSYASTSAPYIVPYGNNYSIRLQDSYGDGWNGSSAYVKVFVDGIEILSETLSGGNSRVVTFDVLGPELRINNVTVNENTGSATFTVTHSGANAAGSFTVDYTTVDNTALAGSDYTTTSGFLTFSGTSGETQTITVPIANDSVFEASPESFFVNLSNVSDTAVTIMDSQGQGTINGNIQVDVPLALYEKFNGYTDYTSTGGTLRTSASNTCAITSSSSNTLTAPLSAGAVIKKAILLWAHSGSTPDADVTFEGTAVTADSGYYTTRGSYTHHGFISDVTAIVNGVANPSTNVYDFTDLTIDNTGNICSNSVTLGGWSLLIFYSDPSFPASSLNLYLGFDGQQYKENNFTLNGFYANNVTDAKVTFLSWEGDTTYGSGGGSLERLSVTNQGGTTSVLFGDGDNTSAGSERPFNSTIYDNTSLPIVNNANTYGIDLDTYDISSYISTGDNTVTANVESAQDYIILNAVILKVPSNLMSGFVFEDVNYGGGLGRSISVPGGQPIVGATVELYDPSGALEDTTITDASGEYVFAGMSNGNYSVRIVNTTVKSSRIGGASCTTCIPVQTYRRYSTGGVYTDVFTEIGGVNPNQEDSTAGVLVGAQSVTTVSITNNGTVDLNFGFNFNTIVNTNSDGQGSLAQFIENSNNLEEASLDIDANVIFNPGLGEDTSIFMIPSTSDPLGRVADGNFSLGVFDILQTNSNQLPAIIAANTYIDGRTQTAYSGDTNFGNIGAGGTGIGVSGTLLPVYNLPEIQVHRNSGDVIKVQADNTMIRNIAVYANNNAGIRFSSGTNNILNACLLGVDANGVISGNMDYDIELEGGETTVTENYFSGNARAGVRINGSTVAMISLNHFNAIGNSACENAIAIENGSGIVVRNNLIENSAGMGIDGASFSGGALIEENTITNSGQNGGNCSGSVLNNGIRLHGSNSAVYRNIIANNGGAGVVITGGVSTGNLISQNSIFNNGVTIASLGIDLDMRTSGNRTGDGVTINDLNDSDTGANGGINFPVIASVTTNGVHLIIKGWARPGAVLEFFLTDISEGTASIGDNQMGLTKDYGEGQVYIGTAIEGSVSDLSGASSTYADIDGNTDLTNQFLVKIPISSSTIPGNFITATATLGNTTSEFSTFAKVKVTTIITNRRVTYRVGKS